MIKKITKAIFLNGDYKGEYDWKGGIPLSEDEIITIKINNELLKYKLTQKEVLLSDTNEDQSVTIVYTFNLN